MDHQADELTHARTNERHDGRRDTRTKINSYKDRDRFTFHYDLLFCLEKELVRLYKQRSDYLRPLRGSVGGVPIYTISMKIQAFPGNHLHVLCNTELIALTRQQLLSGFPSIFLNHVLIFFHFCNLKTTVVMY